MNLIIIFSVLICLGSVTAQDSSNTNLTIDDSSPTDISQINVVDETYETVSVEGISESSANEQNSSKNLPTTVSVSKSSDKLGVSNDNEILGYTHTYTVQPRSTLATELAKHETVSSGQELIAKNGDNTANAYYSPGYIMEGDDVTLYLDNLRGYSTMTLTLDGKSGTQTHFTSVGGKSGYMVATITGLEAGKHSVYFHNTGGAEIISSVELIVHKNTRTVLHLNESEIALGNSVGMSVDVYDKNNHNIVDGTVSYYLEDGTLLAKSQPVTATVPYVPSKVGDYKIYAVYEGYLGSDDVEYAKSTSDLEDLKVKANSAVTVSSDFIIVGQTATITVDLVNSTGIDTITISDGTNTYSYTNLKTVTSGEKYTFNVPNLKPGTYTVSVTNTVNTDSYKPNSGEGTITVSKATSSIDVDDQTITYGETVDITATIVNSTGISSVTLYKDGEPYTDVTPTISGDKITITNLPQGEYTLNATTAGDDNHNASWDTCKIIVNPAGSEVVVPSQTIVFDASAVLDITGQNTTGISKVEIIDKDGNIVDVTPSVDGQKVTVSGLNVGEYTVRVTNAVDDNHVQDTDEGKITVLPAGSEVTVEDKTVVYGDPITVSVGGENTTGISEVVILDEDGNIVDVTPTVDGQKVTVSGLDVGNYTIRVTNAVDDNHVQDTGEGKITVTKAGSEVTVENKTVVYGDPITVSVGGENTTGISKIEVLKDGEVVSVVYTNTSSEITFNDLDVGNYTVKVTNAVDGNHEITTGVGTINVTKAKSSVDMDDVVINHGEDVNAPATTKNATGIAFVVLKDGQPVFNGEGVGSDDSYDVIVKDLEPGEYTLRVTTQVDDDHESVTEDFKITVNPVVDLTITKELQGETTVLVGDEITYIIKVTNNGPSTATDVKVTDTLTGPAKIIYEKVVASDDTSFENNVWTIGTLAKDATVTLTLVVNATEDGTVANTAVVSCKENKTDKQANATNVTVKPSADLGVDKTVGVNTALVGDNVVYTITVTNNGPSKATGVKVTEKLSDLVEFVSADGDGSYDDEAGIWSIDSIDAKGTAVLTLTVKVIGEGNITNFVSVKGNENDTNKSNDNDTADNVTAYPSTDLEITKTVDRTTANVGEEITYTITVKNNGPSKATGVKVTEELSDLVELAKDVDGYDGKVWSVGDLDAGESKKLVLVVKIIANGTIANNVNVSGNENDTDKSNNNATADNVTAVPVVDLEITKTVDKTTANVGENITYTITVTNNGPSKATGVKVTETLSDLVKVVDYGNAKYDNDTNVWTVGDLDKDATATLKLVVNIIANGTVENSVFVKSAENDTDMSNNNATSNNVTAVPVVDLEITKKVDRTKVQVGDEITFTITVTNNGPSKATGVKVAEELSDLVELTKDVDGYDGKVWTVGDLAKGDTKELVLVVKVIGNGTISNNVSVTSKENDTNKTNNNATSDNVTVESVVDLEISKVVDKTTVNVGEEITYTITVKNNGPSKATGVKVAEELSDLVELAKAVDGYDGKVWTVGDLDVGKSKELVLVVKVINNGTVENFVSVKSNENDTDMSNNNATADNVTAYPVVDLEITKTVDKTTANVGENITYTITVTNKGPSKATGVKVTETLSDLVKVVDYGNAKYDKDTNVWTVGDLDKDATATLKLVVNIIANGTVENSVFVKSAENDTDMSNNNATSNNVTAVPVVDLEISKSVDKTTANVGEEITFTITVKNNGPSKATGVKVTEELSDLVELTKEVDGYKDGIWTVGDLDVDESKELVLVVKIIANGTVENFVSVKSNENDTNMSNNNATSDNVTGVPVVDLEITKVVDKTTVNVGEEITYTITVKNNGPSKATGVKVAEELSDLVELAKAVDGYDGKVWTVGDLDVGETKELVLVVKVINNGTVENFVSVKSAENDTNMSNNNDTADNVTAVPVVDLEISKSVDKTTANVGEEITYTITVKNNGPSKATGVKVTEELSDLVELAKDVDGYSDGVWTVGDLDIGETKELVLVVKVIANGTVENFVSVKSSENDTNMSNNNATSDNVTGVPVVDLEITKVVDKTTVNVGEEITYTITVKNNGPSKATGVKVAEELSDLVELTEDVDGYDGKVWTVGDLDVGETKELSLVVKVIANGTVENFVSVRSNENDTNKSNNNATSDNVTAVPVVDLEITKVVDKTTVNVGEEITYTITVTNKGPSKATGVKVAEELSDLVELAEDVDGYDGKVWTVGDLDVGEAKELVLVVKVINNGTVENFVSVRSNENDTDKSNNNDTADNVTAVPVVDLEITKVVDKTVANVGENLTYTITVTNKGPSKATGVKVTETLSDLVKVVDFGDADYDVDSNVWTVGDLDKDATATLKLVVEIINNGTVENSVFVKSAENDTDKSNNNATSENVTAKPVSDLSINKTVNTTQTKVGQSIVYTIVVKNNGPSTATGVQVTEKLSDLVVFVSAAGDGSYDDETGIWNVGTLANGSTAQIALTVKVINNGTIENGVVVKGNEEDTNETNNNYTSDNVTAAPVVNLVANVTVNETTPIYGEEIEFVIEITNEGPSDATNVTVHDAIPEGLKDVTVTPSVGTYDPVKGTWTIGKIKVGEKPVLRISGIVNTLVPFKDTVEITHMEEREDETADDNATSPEVDPVPIVDVELTIVVDKANVDYGDVVEFIITVRNNGPNDASDVSVDNVIPDGFVYVSDNLTDTDYQATKDKLMAPGSEPSFDASTNVWYIGDLANGSETKLALMLQANYVGTKAVDSSVSAAERETDDTNNKGSADVTVSAIADIQLEKTVDKTKIKTGDKVTYTFTVTNNGPNDATGVKMTDSAITQFRFVSASSDDYDSETGVWTIGDLANGSSVTLTVTVIIDKAGTYPNSASVSANENDTNVSNNNDSSDDVVVEEPEVDPDVPQNETSEVPEKPAEMHAELLATGNPIFMALLVLVTAILLPLRRRD